MYIAAGFLEASWAYLRVRNILMGSARLQTIVPDRSISLLLLFKQGRHLQILSAHARFVLLLIASRVCKALAQGF